METSASVPEGTTVTEASAPVVSTASTVMEQQGLTEVSEADLRGPSSEASASTETESQTAPPEPAKEQEPKEATEVKTEEKSEEAKENPVEEEKAGIKTPKGYVPTAALHEVRGENKYLKSQIAELTKQLSANQQPQSSTTEEAQDTFVQLSDDEFVALSEESPKDALLYMKQLNQYNEDRRIQESITQQTQKLYDSVSKEMETIVPGLFSDDTVAEEFRSFAETIGFTEDLFYLTNPSTMVIMPGESEPTLLGDQAAKLIKLLANVKQGQKPVVVPDLEKIKSDLRKEIETEILAKVKSGESFKSLSSAPNTQTNRPEFSDKMLSEAAFMRLSSKEQEIYLAGQ